MLLVQIDDLDGRIPTAAPGLGSSWSLSAVTALDDGWIELWYQAETV